MVLQNSYAQKVIDNYTPIRYFPLWESSGTNVEDITTNADDGTAAGGLTWSATGIADGNTAATFDGTNDQINIYSAALNTAFDGQTGSLVVWLKVTAAGTWTDSTSRYAVGIRVDSNHNLFIVKTSNDNQLRCTYEAATVVKTVAIASSALTWQMVGITWALGAGADGEMKAYLNGAQSGATQTTLGTWAGALLSTGCVIGDVSTTATSPWKGVLAHISIYDAVIGDAGMAALYSVNPGMNPQNVLYNVKPRFHWAGV